MQAKKDLTDSKKEGKFVFDTIYDHPPLTTLQATLELQVYQHAFASPR